MMFWNNMLTGVMWATVVFAFLVRCVGVPASASYKESKAFGCMARLGNWCQKNHVWLVVVAIVVGMGVRVWGFGAIPAGFNQDGAMAAVDAKALADYGTDRFGMTLPVHFTAWGYGQMSVLLSYLMVPFIKIFGLSETVARLPAVLVSIAGLLALYGLIKNAFGRSASLIVLALAAINPWHIMQSRWALDCNMFPHFFIIGCYLLHQGGQSKRRLHLAMLSFALCMYSYGVAFLTVPLFLLGVSLYARLAGILTTRAVALAAGTYAFFSWPVWLVMVVNFLKLQTIHVGLMTIPFFPESVRSKDIVFFADSFGTQLRENLSALGRTVIFQNPDLPWNALDNFGTQYLFSLPFVVLGVGYLAVRIWRRDVRTQGTGDSTATNFGSVIVLGGLAIGLWTGLVIGSVNVNRINIIYYFLIIPAGLGLLQVARWFRPAFLLSGAVYPVFFCLFCAHYFGTWSTEIGAYFFEGMGQALHQAAKIDTPKYYITVNSQGDNSRGISEILTLFHHRIDARYFQGADFPPGNPKLSSETIAGNKYGTSYANRYVYISPPATTIDPHEKAVYVVNSVEEALFDRTYFDVTSYKGFSLATPKAL